MITYDEKSKNANGGQVDVRNIGCGWGRVYRVVHVKYLHRKGLKPIVLDNLSLGHKELVKWGPLYEGDLDDLELLARVFARHDIQAVMHFAAFCYVGESVTEPLKILSE